jgi:hypothetical protein
MNGTANHGTGYLQGSGNAGEVNGSNSNLKGLETHLNFDLQLFLPPIR